MRDCRGKEILDLKGIIKDKSRERKAKINQRKGKEAVEGMSKEE